MTRRESPRWSPASGAFRRGTVRWGDLEEILDQGGVAVGGHRGQLWDRIADKFKGNKLRILLARNSHPEGGTPTKDNQEDQDHQGFLGTGPTGRTRHRGRPTWTSPSAAETSAACSWPVWPLAWWLAASSSVSPCPKLQLLWVVSLLAPLVWVSRCWAQGAGARSSEQEMEGRTEITGTGSGGWKLEV